MNQIKRIMAIDPWEIKSDTLEIEDRRLQESLTAIGNGYMGMRGNFSETYSGDSHQGFYLAGVGIQIRPVSAGGRMAIRIISGKSSMPSTSSKSI